MKRRGFTIIEAVVILVILGILAAILYPVMRPRPLTWSKTPMPPLSFKNAELQTVVTKLHQELYKKRKMSFLKDTKWEKQNLKGRRITFETRQGLTLKQVFAVIEKKAGIVFQGGGSCGTCGLPMGSLTIIDTPKK